MALATSSMRCCAGPPYCPDLVLNSPGRIKVAGSVIHQSDTGTFSEPSSAENPQPIGVQLNCGLTKEIEAGRPDLDGVRIEISDAQPGSWDWYVSVPGHFVNVIGPAAPSLKAPTTDV